jgi:tryptophan synthase alpha chain
LQASDDAGLDRIFLVSPSSTDERSPGPCLRAAGWVYATSVMGVTGARTESSSAAPALVARIRAADPTRWSASASASPTGPRRAEVTGYADAAIVGSGPGPHAAGREEAGRPDDLSGLRAAVADLADGVRTASRELTSQT